MYSLLKIPHAILLTFIDFFLTSNKNKTENLKNASSKRGSKETQLESGGGGGARILYSCWSHQWAATLAALGTKAIDALHMSNIALISNTRDTTNYSIRFICKIVYFGMNFSLVKTYFSIQRGSRGPRKVGLSSQPWIPSRIEVFPGKIANRSAEIPFISLTILLKDS